MKTSILRTLIPIILSAALGPAALKAQGCITANIPFAFTVGKQLLVSGDYCVQPVSIGSSVLSIRSVSRPIAIMAMTMPADASRKPDAKPFLVFKQYGDSYFLYRVAGSGLGWQFLQSTAERDLIARKAQPNPVTLAGVFTPK